MIVCRILIYKLPIYRLKRPVCYINSRSTAFGGPYVVPITPIPLRVFPPHQGSGAGIALKAGEWVSGWYPAATELNVPKKAYSSQKQLVSF